ncbi:MAG: hypothetical protein AAF467_19300 [Actinomycetota bacterium]
MAGTRTDAAANESRRSDNQLELAAAVILGLAAVAIAWSGFQESRWDGENATSLTDSIRLQNAAFDEYQLADAQVGFDHAVFVQIVASGVCDTDPGGDACVGLLDQVSFEGQDAIDRWLDNDDLVPFRDDAAYLDPLYEEGDRLADESEMAFQAAAEADENGDGFGMASTILAAVLFFAGISVVLDNVRLRIVLLAISSLMLVGSLLFLATVPMA